MVKLPAMRQLEVKISAVESWKDRLADVFHLSSPNQPLVLVQLQCLLHAPDFECTWSCNSCVLFTAGERVIWVVIKILHYCGLECHTVSWWLTPLNVWWYCFRMHRVLQLERCSHWFTPYGIQGGNAPWFMCWFQRYVNCLFVCFFLFLFLCFFSHLFTSLLVYFLNYLLLPE